MSRDILFYEQSFVDRPAFDAGVSRALLGSVADGRQPESLRLHRSSKVVAFSVLDRARPGFAEAVEATRQAGYGAILRLAGGRAAVFHEETLTFAWCVPEGAPREGIRARFDAIAGLMCKAFRSLGVDAYVGEVAGEYCPGEHSVNARGKKKLMGVGQRIVRGSAHIGGVVVIGGSEKVRDVLVPVYEAMDFAWNPDTVGAIQEEAPSVGMQEVREALIEAWNRDYRLIPGDLPASVMEEAEAREKDHFVL